MPLELTINLMLVGAVISVLLAGIAWSASKRDEGRPFALFMAAVFAWCLFSYLRYRVPVPGDRLLYYRFEYLGVASVPYWLFLFVRAFVGRPLRTWQAFALALIPCSSVVLAFASDWTSLFWSVDFPGNILRVRRGPWYWVHTFYSYLLIFHSLISLIMKIKELEGMIRSWFILMLFFLLLPLAANLWHFLEIAVQPDAMALDFTPIAFAVSGLGIGFCFRNYNFLDSLPFAKNLVFDSLRDPVLAIDAKGRIIGVNQAGRELFPDAATPGKLEIAKLCPQIVPILAEGGTVNWNEMGHSYNVTLNRMDSKPQGIGGAVVFFYDVTEYYETLYELSVAREKANAANEAKGLFLASMSHEVRTPLNAVIGLTELTLQSQLSAEQKDNLETVLTAARSLLELLNDILDLSKLEAGRMALERIDFDFRDRIESVVRTFRLGAEHKGLSLDLWISDKVPRWVKGDPLKLGQILGNLLGNAVKFTVKGGITIHVDPAPSWVRPHPSPDYQTELRSVGIRVSVQDTGIGIAADKQDRLFESFSQAESSTSRKYGGTGLGLAICRSLSALLGGDVELVSSPGKGSTFSFTAFFEPGKEPILPEIAPSAELEDLSEAERKLSILLVEDSLVSAKAVVKRLSHAGHDVVVAETGRKALDFLAMSCFDLLLLDLETPDLGGIEVTELIRSGKASCGAGREIPIIAMTGHSEAEAGKACRDAGTDGFLTKPINFTTLFALMDRIVRPRLSHKAGLAGAEDPAPRPDARHPPAPSTAHIDRKGPLQRLGGDIALFNEVLGIFVEESLPRRLDLEKALAVGDRESLRALAHKLRGGSRTIGAEPLAAAAEALEKALVARSPSTVPGPEGEAQALGGLVSGLLELLEATCQEAKSILPPGYVAPKDI
jgi:signal transduction histidine kinase/CheY-like chemotaxis protein/HPt (histidine-containing phosphotransfer) domain-containing protein